MKDDEMTRLRHALSATKGLGRREFMKAIGGTAVGASMFANMSMMFSSKALAASEPVTTMGWGGSWQDALYESIFDPITKETGIPINYITPYNFAQVKAMYDAGNMEIDFLGAGAMETVQIPRLGMNAEIDWDQIDTSKLTENQLGTPNSITANSVSNVIVYNKSKWPGEDHPKSMADFWDTDRFPGPRAMQRRAYPNFEAATVALTGSTDPADIYPLDPDRALAKLDEIRPHVAVWWESGGQQQQLIQDEEVDLIIMWNGRAADSIINNDANYEIVWNQALLQEPDLWFLMEGAPNRDGALDVLNWVGRAELQATFARLLYYGPTNMGAYDLLDEELARQLPTHPDNVAKALSMKFSHWADVYDDFTRQFELWLQS